MKLAFLELPADERRLYIEQAAVRRNITPVVLEKDFWVCWLLGILFESEFAGSLVFKGGTSLSKVFGAIERFFSHDEQPHQDQQRQRQHFMDHDRPQFIQVIESCSSVANDTQMKYGP